MVVFEKPYPIDFLYIKLEEDPRVLSEALCEFLQGDLVWPECDQEQVTVLLTDQKTKKEQKLSIPLDKFRVLLMEHFSSNQLGTLTNFEFQPAGECLLASVREFIEKHHAV